MTGSAAADEFAAIGRISALSGLPVHRALSNLRGRPILHTAVIEQTLMENTLIEIVDKITT